jgi:HD-GYP domain-containing protein (c-di-GMP phosphodiesterase class II)
MKTGTAGLVFALSDALDAVENEFIGAEASHARRVAYSCLKMGKKYGMSNEMLEDFAICAVMHDSALTETYSALLHRDDALTQILKQIGSAGAHCERGQENIASFPFLTDVYKDVILYHHEEANGTGPFHKKAEEIPFASEILHLADSMDNETRAYHAKGYHWDSVKEYLESKRGIRYSSSVVDLFFSVFDRDSWEEINTADINVLLKKALPICKMDLTDKEMEALCHTFGTIVDSKSPFTLTHSNGIAAKARKMGEYYKMDEEKCYKLLFAGYLHDIGKMMIPNTILEKPGSLTFDEYKIMKMHVTYSYQMLSQISGIDDIRLWACSHHERLDGRGYPFGKSAENLTKEERILAVIDVYQALREDRPYRKGLEHRRAMTIINDMVKNGGLDGDIAHDVDFVFGS